MTDFLRITTIIDSTPDVFEQLREQVRGDMEKTDEELFAEYDFIMEPASWTNGKDEDGYDEVVTIDSPLGVRYTADIDDNEFTFAAYLDDCGFAFELAAFEIEE